MQKRRTICLDFDDTINDYPGWISEGYIQIRGKPLPGVRTAVKRLRAQGWIVVVYSVRCRWPKGRTAIRNYLSRFNIQVDDVCADKPAADIYLDDKALTFTGDWSSAIDAINKFETWKEKRQRASV